MGRHLGIDFKQILIDFGSQVATKLGSKIDKKSIQKDIKNRCEKEGVLEASWMSCGRREAILRQVTPGGPVRFFRYRYIYVFIYLRGCISAPLFF